MISHRVCCPIRFVRRCFEASSCTGQCKKMAQCNFNAAVVIIIHFIMEILIVTLTQTPHHRHSLSWKSFKNLPFTFQVCWEWTDKEVWMDKEKKRKTNSPHRNLNFINRKAKEKQITLLAAGSKSAANTKKNDHYNDIIKLGALKYFRSFSNSAELKWCHVFILVQSSWWEAEGCYSIKHNWSSLLKPTKHSMTPTTFIFISQNRKSITNQENWLASILKNPKS